MLRAADRYDAERHGLGDDFLEVVGRTFDDISSSPLRWPLIDDRHRRRLVKRFPFSIFYRLLSPSAGGGVVIVAVAHHKSHPDYWRRR